MSSADISYQYTNAASSAHWGTVQIGSNITVQPSLMQNACIICGQEAPSLICDQDRETFMLFRRWYLEQKAKELARELNDQG